MIKRMRIIAGPNGSGKSTLMHRLENDYAVNFYDFLNADDIFAEVRNTGAYQPSFAVDADSLLAYVRSSSYDDATKAFFLDGEIVIANDCVRFHLPESINSYTIALLTNFLQHESIVQGRSFSQETVFSHSSKIEALRFARESGFRTYLYFVATSSPRINLSRVANRARQGGHDVPEEKVLSRYTRSIELLPQALPYLSRAYFFDNSSDSMHYLCQWNPEEGLSPAAPDFIYPRWMSGVLSSIGEVSGLGAGPK